MNLYQIFKCISKSVKRLNRLSYFVAVTENCSVLFRMVCYMVILISCRIHINFPVTSHYCEQASVIYTITNSQSTLSYSKDFFLRIMIMVIINIRELGLMTKVAHNLKWYIKDFAPFRNE